MQKRINGKEEDISKEVEKALEKTALGVINGFN